MGKMILAGRHPYGIMYVCGHWKKGLIAFNQSYCFKLVRKSSELRQTTATV